MPVAKSEQFAKDLFGQVLLISCRVQELNGLWKQTGNSKETLPAKALQVRTLDPHTLPRLGYDSTHIELSAHSGCKYCG